MTSSSDVDPDDDRPLTRAQFVLLSLGAEVALLIGTCMSALLVHAVEPKNDFLSQWLQISIWFNLAFGINWAINRHRARKVRTTDPEHD
ncbi:MAG: hypothetical protein EPN91_02540 [Salinibacterium sp.]|nr:MAG: hypothetical protein EPN91_02540 [Salinibacterium sp.]